MLGKTNASNSGGVAPIEQELYNVCVVDYDGTVLKEENLPAGSVFELPTVPTHEGLTFDEWSCSTDITNNTVTVTDNNIAAGPIYHTNSGKLEVIVNVVKGTTITLTNYSNEVDWGDGTVDSNTTHTYTNDGEHMIKFILSGSTLNYKLFNTNSGYCVTSVRFPAIATLKTIDNSAFYQFYNLKTLSLSRYITKITNSAFSSTNIQAIILPQSITNISSCFSGVRVRYLVLPKSSSFTTIGSSTFSGTFIENLAIPSTLTTMNGYIPSYSMEKLIIPSTLKIPYFAQCRRLKKVIMSTNAATLSNTFSSCNSLKEIIWTNTGNTTTNTMFSDCYALKELVVPDGVTNVTRMFYVNAGIEKVTFPNTVTTMAEVFYSASSIPQFNMPTSCTNLNGAFRGSTIESFDDFPPNITSLGNAFQECKFLMTITIPSTILTLQNTFNGCISLNKVVLEGDITDIYSYTFSNCANCMTYDFTHCTAVPNLPNSNAFTGINANAKILVPASLETAWKNDTNWSSLASHIVGV